MNKKKIQQLITLSYTKGVLDEKKVQTIGNIMNRKQLKRYIRGLKNEENKKRVVVTTPHQLSSTEKKQFETLFKNKNLEFILDPSIITGVRIQKNDVIFENSLSQTFGQLTKVLGNYE